jgi:hypothetical protein
MKRLWKDKNVQLDRPSACYRQTADRHVDLLLIAARPKITPQVQGKTETRVIFADYIQSMDGYGGV